MEGRGGGRDSQAIHESLTFFYEYSCHEEVVFLASIHEWSAELAVVGVHQSTSL